MTLTATGSDIEKPAYDIWRDSPLRLVGYANELGESFKPLISVSLYRLSYAVAATYVVGDAQNKYFQNSRAVDGIDALVWQGLASVAVPGFVINRIVWGVGRAVATTSSVPLKTWLPTVCGLSSIPFIVHPIDTGVHKAMDLTVRRLYE
mmetsp:Transcript_152030/g.264971  ORF Transcript_152030/g.264971 Transcript_152030/m.264971 type:complete len:149 (+) Transcript_152030:13-459(+)